MTRLLGDSLPLTTPMTATLASDGNLLDAFGEAMACYDVGTAEHAARVGSRARRIASADRSARA